MGPTHNWLRFLDMVEIVINNAPIATTELSHFYLNLCHHPHLWFDVRNFAEARLEGDETIQVKDRIAKLRADWSHDYLALYHEQALSGTFVNLELTDC